jgi:hypothetical protein
MCPYKALSDGKTSMQTWQQCFCFSPWWRRGEEHKDQVILTVISLLMFLFLLCFLISDWRRFCERWDVLWPPSALPEPKLLPHKSHLNILVKPCKEEHGLWKERDGILFFLVIKKLKSRVLREEGETSLIYSFLRTAQNIWSLVTFCLLLQINILSLICSINFRFFYNTFKRFFDR